MHDFLSIILFFVVYKAVDIYWATSVLIVLSAIQVFYHFFKEREIPTKVWITFVLLLVLGGSTIYFHDDVFLKWKVTVINGLFALVLWGSNAFFKQNVLKNMLSDTLMLSDKSWNKVNQVWVIFFAFCAISNWYVAFHWDQETWVTFKVFGLSGLSILCSLVSLLLVKDELTKPEHQKLQ